MTDRELLELAAKAAGINLYWTKDGGKLFRRDVGIQTPWNPLEHDGDALRLAVKLGLLVDVSLRGEEAEAGGADVPYQVERFMDNANDPYAATRRAIVRAAAEIGRGME